MVAQDSCDSMALNDWAPAGAVGGVPWFQFVK